MYTTYFLSTKMQVIEIIEVTADYLVVIALQTVWLNR